MELGGEPAEEREPDEIDELVDLGLRKPMDNYAAKYSVKCPKCGGQWHGLVRDGCRGATGKLGTPDPFARKPSQ